MVFKSSTSSPFFSKQEELDHLVWKERMAKLNKKLNSYLSEMTDEDSYFFCQWLQDRKLFCEKCNNQFYSKIGLRGHVC